MCPTKDESTEAWPRWMLRYMLRDGEQEFWDLITSVGGSPPWGGISHEEAGAIYHLAEDFRGKGMSSPGLYAAARKLLAAHPDRKRMLDLFECHDRIVSDSENYGLEVVREGLRIAKAMKDAAAIGLFTLYEAGVSSRKGDNAKAARLSLKGLDLLLEAVESEPAAGHRVAQAAQNAIALTAMSGDVARAKSLLEDLSEVLPAAAVPQLRNWVAAQERITS
jgi:hypothetical protein